MEKNNAAQQVTQPGWKVAVGIFGFIIGLIVLLVVLKSFIG